MTMNYTPSTQGRSLRIGKNITIAAIVALIAFFVIVIWYLANLGDEDVPGGEEVLPQVTVTEHQPKATAKVKERNQQERGFTQYGAPYPQNKVPTSINDSEYVPDSENSGAQASPAPAGTIVY